MKLFKSITAGIILVTMAVSLVACGGDTSWVAKKDDTTISAGRYICYLMDATNAAKQKVTEKDKDLKGQLIDGKDAEQWALDSAMEQLKESVFIDSEMKRLNISFTEDEENQAKQYATQYWGQMKDMYGKNGVSEDSYGEYIKDSFKYDKLFKAYFGEDGEMPVSTDELKEEFYKDYSRIKMTSASTVDSKTNQPLSDDAINVIKTRFEGYQKRVDAGEDIENVIKDEKKFQAAQSGTGDESSNASEESQAEQDNNLIIHVSDSGLSEDTQKQFNELPLNGTLLVNENNSYNLIQKFDVKERDKDFDDSKYSVLIAMKKEDFFNKLKDDSEKVDVSINKSAIKKYSPSRVILE